METNLATSLIIWKRRHYYGSKLHLTSASPPQVSHFSHFNLRLDIFDSVPSHPRDALISAEDMPQRGVQFPDRYSRSLLTLGQAQISA